LDLLINSKLKTRMREKLNPIRLLEIWGWPADHISFNPSLKESEADFFRARGSSHDGTVYFSTLNLQELLIGLVNKKSFSRKNPPIKGKIVIDIKYQVGFIKLAIVFGKINIAGGCYPGQRDRCRISVKCEYIYKE
jgi:hypothetical protein